MKIELKYSGIIEEILQRLKLISGKRATTRDEYFRHTACKEDIGTIGDILKECIAFLSLKMSAFMESYSISSDIIIIILKPLVADESRQSTLEITIREILVSLSISRWLKLTGLKDYESWTTKDENTIGCLTAMLSKKDRLKCRPLSTF